jgi:hypothetical protein
MDTRPDGSRQTAIRVCAAGTLILAAANMPLSFFGAAMAVMNGPGFFAAIASMFALVVVAVGLSLWALTHPRWWAVTTAGVCCLPATVVYRWLLG